MGELTSPVGGGAYAQYAVANARDIALKPRRMEFDEAAGIPTVGATVWGYLVGNAGSMAGKRILIQGGAGGVGSAAVQIAKARGAHVIATASGRNHDYLRRMGVDETIDYTTTKFEDIARDVDIVFDTVGGETLQRSYAVVRRGGMLISIVDELSATECARRGIKCPGEAPSDGAGPALDAIRELAEAGKFRLNVDRTFALEKAAEAQELSREGRTRGKIVLRVGTWAIPPGMSTTRSDLGTCADSTRRVIAGGPSGLMTIHHHLNTSQYRRGTGSPQPISKSWKRCSDAALQP